VAEDQAVTSRQRPPIVAAGNLRVGTANPTASASTSTDPSAVSGSGTSSSRADPAVPGATVTAFMRPPGSVVTPLASPLPPWCDRCQDRCTATWHPQHRRWRLPGRRTPPPAQRRSETDRAAGIADHSDQFAGSIPCQDGPEARPCQGTRSAGDYQLIRDVLDAHALPGGVDDRIMLGPVLDMAGELDGGCSPQIHALMVAGFVSTCPARRG
jgi:hypothetical protein